MSLIVDRQKAITFSLFRDSIQSDYSHSVLTDLQYQQAIANIKGIISKQYTSRYLDVFEGTIVTGIPGFSYYDELAKDKFLTNYLLFTEIFNPLYTIYQKCFHEILKLRLNSKYQTLHTLLQWIVIGLRQLTNAKTDVAVSMIRRYRANTSIVMTYNDFISNSLGLFEFIRKQSNEMEGFKKMQTRILLVVATHLELDIVLKKLKTISPVSASVGELSYHTVVINNSLVYIVKCQMGQSGVGGSILTLEEAIRKLNPDFVIMGGIAWGANKKKQKTGDLLISIQVWDYDIERVNSDGTMTPRGPISPSSARLVQMFEVACASIIAYKVNFGLVASGSDLLDNREYVNRLKEKQPELIGGDMESAGMASVCSRKKIDWVLVKGICDWGYNKDSHKKEYQQKAATNSIDAIAVVLSQIAISS
jgi:nucleoside phosphorylase